MTAVGDAAPHVPVALPGGTVVVPPVAAGNDGLGDLFTSITRIAEAASPAVVVCGTGAVPVGYAECSRAALELVRAQLVCRRLGSRLALVGSTPELRAVITLLGFDEVLPEHRW
ncbi:MAG: hypothetical protein AVDCRST_MAG66-410 [uncultured Pseudonocardia sp.]|uniref:STAS domain-containing protein n=1 Tax=uncultured Pseudonocardia sp. TaxID=211455 RepID=A0A6J4NAD3_9PSEU|nr:MAG: hypothetical protein AVDCRST_MAG66-410 [uncultured Pseudonocardia sp.]